MVSIPMLEFYNKHRYRCHLPAYRRLCLFQKTEKMQVLLRFLWYWCSTPHPPIYTDSATLQAFKVPIIFYPKKIQKVPLPYQTVLNNLMVHHNLCWYRYPVPTSYKHNFSDLKLVTWIRILDPNIEFFLFKNQ